MDAHYHVMHRDLYQLQEHWKDKDEFKIFTNLVNKIKNENEKLMMQEIFPDKLFAFSMAALEKHFNQWREYILLPIFLAGEPETGTVMEKWFTGK